MLPRLPAGTTIQSGGLPAALLQQLPDDRLLALEAPGVDGVEEGDAEGLRGLAHEAQAGVEVALHEQGARAVGEGLGELARRDLPGGDEHERGKPGLRRVGGHRGRGVAGRGAGHRRGARAHGLGHRHRHAAVLEGAGGVLALVLEREVVVADPARDRVPAVERGVALGVREDGPAAPGSRSSRKRQTPLPCTAGSPSRRRRSNRARRTAPVSRGRCTTSRRPPHGQSARGLVAGSVSPQSAQRRKGAFTRASLPRRPPRRGAARAATPSRS